MSHEQTEYLSGIIKETLGVEPLRGTPLSELVKALCLHVRRHKENIPVAIVRSPDPAEGQKVPWVQMLDGANLNPATELYLRSEVILPERTELERTLDKVLDFHKIQTPPGMSREIASEIYDLLLMTGKRSSD